MVDRPKSEDTRRDSVRDAIAKINGSPRMSVADPQNDAKVKSGEPTGDASPRLNAAF